MDKNKEIKLNDQSTENEKFHRAKRKKKGHEETNKCFSYYFFLMVIVNH